MEACGDSATSGASLVGSAVVVGGSAMGVRGDPGREAAAPAPPAGERRQMKLAISKILYEPLSLL